MTRIAYTVTATLPDEAAAVEYIAWLEDGHIDQVIHGGAHSAMIIRLAQEKPTDPTCVEVRYIFSTQEIFESYVQHHAPKLRAEGLSKFPPARGITFQRRIGEII